MPVLAHGPCGVVQVWVQILFERNVAAAAELVAEGNGFSSFQNKASVLVHQLGVCVHVGGVLCVFGVFQITAFDGVVIRDFLLIGCKAGHLTWHRFGNEGKVPEIDVAVIVIAHADGFDVVVKTALLFHLVQVQLYGDPLVCRHFDRAIRCAVNACCAKAAFLDFFIIQQFQIQVVEGKATFTTIRCINVNLERKEAHVFDIDGVSQRQDATTFLTRCTLRILIACVPVKDLFGILPGIWLGIWPAVCFLLENVVLASCDCGGNAANIRIQIHHFGRSTFIRVSGRCCSIMGCLVLDGEVEDFLACKAVFEVIISNVFQIDLFLNLQLVIIREVERHRHVGLPHTAFHVVHGKGVLAGGEVGNINRIGIVILCRIIAFIIRILQIITNIYNFFLIRCISTIFLPRNTIIFYLTDISGNFIFIGSSLVKINNTCRFAMGTANVKYQLAINKYPNIIVTREIELD